MEPTVTHLLQATHAVGGEHDDWLDGVMAALKPSFDMGLGIYAYRFEAPSPGTFRPGPLRFLDCDEAIRAFARRGLELTNPDIVRETLLAHPAGTTSATIGRDALGFLLEHHLPPCGARDSLAISAVDPDGHGCLLVAPLREMQRLSPARLLRWQKVSAHIASGYRLRRRLQGRDLVDAASAVFDGEGRIQHADADVRPRLTLEMLQGAVSRVLSARSRNAPTDPLDLWTALVQGEWSIVRHVDTDRRELFIAARNPPVLRPHRQLSLRELQVASYASYGHATKFIAYELGLSLSTVATHLGAALRKLGLADRLALIKFVRELAGEAVAHGSDVPQSRGLP